MRNQNFAKGGLFWEVKTTVNELEPNFHQFWIRSRRFFCQNQVIPLKKKVFTNIETVIPAEIGWSPKKKGHHQNSVTSPDQLRVRSTFLVQITASPSQLLLPNPVGRAVFIFGAKIGLKSSKNVLFCILFRPMRGLQPPWLRSCLRTFFFYF